MIVVHAYVYAQTEHREAYRAGLQAMREATLAGDAGCLEYSVWADSDDPDKFVFVERWTDLASLKAHIDAPHHVGASAALEALRARPADIHVFEAEPIDL
ncbi:putative quinol monooxygenase [Glycomyces buryatensis]|nr:putative quinol monooxygenase [Glycomyces buryatensis]